MGTIARQTVKGSVYSYIGAGLGFLNVAILMPHIFSTEEIGLTNILISISAIFGQLGCLGFNNVTTRLFPYFRNKDKSHNGFLFLTVISGLIGFALCLLLFILLKPYLIKENIDSSPLFVEYIYLLIPLIFITIFFLLFDTYNRVLFNASFGIFVKEFILRVLNLAGIILFYFNYFDFNAFIIYYTAVYAIPVILIFALLFYRKEISINPVRGFLSRSMKFEIFNVSIYGLVSGFSGIAAMHIDRYMVNHFCDLGFTGIYATAFFFGTIILLPGRSLLRIAGTSIAEAFKSQDHDKIEQLYSKSTKNQLLAATVAFIIIWGNIDNILNIMPEAYSQGKYVIFYISLAYLFLMGGGASSEIIQFSKHYKVYAALMLLLIACIIVLNILLIPVYGITGAALASFISYVIYVFSKYIFLLYKFGFQPFNHKHILIVLTGGFAYFISLLIPSTEILFLDIFIKSAIMFISFTIPAYFLKFSIDLNHFAEGILKKLK